MEYRIDKNIPIPTVRKKRSKWIERARQMEVGNSYFVELTKVNGLLAAIKKVGYNYRSESETLGGVDGRRVWRTE